MLGYTKMKELKKQHRNKCVTDKICKMGWISIFLKPDRTKDGYIKYKRFEFKKCCKCGKFMKYFI